MTGHDEAHISVLTYNTLQQTYTSVFGLEMWFKENFHKNAN